MQIIIAWHNATPIFGKKIYVRSTARKAVNALIDESESLNAMCHSPYITRIDWIDDDAGMGIILTKIYEFDAISSHRFIEMDYQNTLTAPMFYYAKDKLGYVIGESGNQRKIDAAGR